jgi:hypothetical protein
MRSCFSQLEFPVVSCPHTISKYISLVHVLIYWYHFHVEPNLSWFHFHLTWKTVSISQCNLPGSGLIWWNKPTGTGQVNATRPVGSTLSWSAQFKHRHISVNAVHVWGDWQHLKGHCKTVIHEIFVVSKVSESLISWRTVQFLGQGPVVQKKFCHQPGVKSFS